MKFGTVFLFTVVFSAFAQSTLAGTIDLRSLSVGEQGSDAVTIANAMISTPNDDLFVFGDGQFGMETGPEGAICAIDGRRCLGDVEIWFTGGPVSDLTFEALYGGPLDLAIASIFHNDRMIGSASVSTGEMVDFTGFSGVTRLLLEDQGSLSAGFAYGRFNFATGAAGGSPTAPPLSPQPPSPSPVPLPAGLPLLIAALGGLGVMRLRQSRRAA